MCMKFKAVVFENVFRGDLCEGNAVKESGSDSTLRVRVALLTVIKPRNSGAGCRLFMQTFPAES
jgi:hypothetical protein